jgi:hypothetical protein
MAVANVIPAMLRCVAQQRTRTPDSGRGSFRRIPVIGELPQPAHSRHLVGHCSHLDPIPRAPRSHPSQFCENYEGRYEE